MVNTYRILGIDPGLHVTGYGVVDFCGSKAAVIEAGALRTPTRATLEQRVSLIHAELSKLLAEFKPDLVAVEQLYAHYKHPRTAILMGHARGIILLACQQAGLAIEHLASTKVKKSLTGNGHASKEQVQRTIQSVCKLAKLPSPPDVADALAIALCAGRQRLNY